MPRFRVTGPEPDRIHYDWLVAASPLEALHKLHAEALGRQAVRLEHGALVFADPNDQLLCAGVWRVTETASTGPKTSTEIAIAPPVPAAA